jgi:hypothetical protein
MSSSQDPVQMGQNLLFTGGLSAFNNDFQDQRQLFLAKFTALEFTIARNILS